MTRIRSGELEIDHAFGVTTVRYFATQQYADEDGTPFLHVHDARIVKHEIDQEKLLELLNEPNGHRADIEALEMMGG